MDDGMSTIRQVQVLGTRYHERPYKSQATFCPEKLVETDPRFRQHCKHAHGRWKNVAYIRKSPTKEPEVGIIRLLDKMATKLINRCLCTKVFASPSCLASSALVRRDYTIDRTILSKLKTCDGHMQDLCGFLSTTTANVRLCVIDYAGLSDNPRDKQSFIKLYRCIKEVAVDCLGIVKVYRRHDILKGDVAKKFKSRKGPVRRSA